MENIVGKKVEAEFPNGDKLILTVSEYIKNVPFVDGMSGNILTYNDVYYFKEEKICSWWYKDNCKTIN